MRIGEVLGIILSINIGDRSHSPTVALLLCAKKESNEAKGDTVTGVVRSLGGKSSEK